MWKRKRLEALTTLPLIVCMLVAHSRIAILQFAVREIDSCGYFNLDSKLAEPALIGDRAAMIAFINRTSADHDKQVFLVVSQETANQRSYFLA